MVDKNGRPMPLYVDHDHVTGQIRGLLCYRCNVALATLGDNTAGLWEMVDYLERANERELSPLHSNLCNPTESEEVR